MSLRALTIILILAASASAQEDCSILYSTGHGSLDCQEGSSTNVASFTPSHEMTIYSVRVPNATAEVTVSDMYGRMTKTLDQSADGAILAKPVMMFPGETYYITIKAKGCLTPPSNRLQTPDGTWYIEDTSCDKPPCNLAADLLGQGCKAPTCSDRIRNQDEEGTDCGGPCDKCDNLPATGFAITFTPPKDTLYFGAGIFILALLTITFHIGKRYGQDETINTLVKFKEIGLTRENIRRITMKKGRENG